MNKFRPVFTSMADQLDEHGRFWKDPSVKEQRRDHNREYTLDEYGRWYENGELMNQELCSTRMFNGNEEDPDDNGFWFVFDGMRVEKMDVLGYGDRPGLHILQNGKIEHENGYTTTWTESILRYEDKGMCIGITWLTLDANCVIVPGGNGEEKIWL